MLRHIDQLHSPSKGSYHRVAEGLRLTDHSDHQAVVVGVGLVIQKPHAFFRTEALYESSRSFPDRGLHYNWVRIRSAYFPLIPSSSFLLLFSFDAGVSGSKILLPAGLHRIYWPFDPVILIFIIFMFFMDLCLHSPGPGPHLIGDPAPDGSPRSRSPWLSSRITGSDFGNQDLHPALMAVKEQGSARILRLFAFQSRKGPPARLYRLPSLTSD